MSKFDQQPDHTFDAPIREKETDAIPKRREIRKTDRPIRKDIYPVIDTDLGRDNIENDIPEADLKDL